MAGTIPGRANVTSHAKRPIPPRRDGEAPAQDEGKGGPGNGMTEGRLGPLPGRDTYVPSGARPTPPTWPDGQPAPTPHPTYPAPVYPGAPPQVGRPATPPATEPEIKSVRQEKPLSIGVGMGAIEGKNVNIHYNLSDMTAIGLSIGTSSEGGFNSYTLDLRQYIAREKNWGIYLQPGVHALQNHSDIGPKVAPAISGQLGLEWAMDSGLTFNVNGGGVYSPTDNKFRPTVGVGIGLRF